MLNRFVLSMMIVGGAACGSQSAQGPRPSTELNAEQAALFGDGVDLIEDPEQLEGSWRTDWDRDLDRRVLESDLIVIGTVSTLRAEVDLDHRTSYQLVLGVERTLEGKAPGSELTLTSREGAAGYASIKDHSDHVLERKLVAFVKYAAGSGDAVVAHFHLSAPSQVVLQRVDQYEAQKHPASVQIIEHRQ
jgi:hypothetical protein